MQITDSISGWNIEDLIKSVIKKIIKIANESEGYSEEGLETLIEKEIMEFVQKLPSGTYDFFIKKWRKANGYE